MSETDIENDPRYARKAERKVKAGVELLFFVATYVFAFVVVFWTIHKEN